jgi:hypothetical protein
MGMAGKSDIQAPFTCMGTLENDVTDTPFSPGSVRFE